MVLEIDTVEDLDKKIKNEEQKIERTLTLQERTNKKKAETEPTLFRESFA